MTRLYAGCHAYAIERTNDLRCVSLVAMIVRTGICTAALGNTVSGLSDK